MFNNAGSLLRRMKAVELDEATWSEINLNLTSAALCSHAVVSSMIERGRGAIRSRLRWWENSTGEA